jgi:cobalt-zinc-cadmium efflux system outer membrane protein
MRCSLRGFVCLLLFAWFVPTRLAAQALQLSLPDALERVNQRSPDVVLADAAVREVQARRAGAGIVLPTNPRLSVEMRPNFNGPGLGDVGYAATVDTLFDLGGAPSARVHEVERDVELASAVRNARRIEARLIVFTAYLNAQLAQLRIAGARAGLEIARRVLNAAQTRIDVGAGSDFERASAQLELSRIEASEQSALRDLDEQLMALRDVLDLPAESALELTTQIDVPPELQPLARYLQDAQKIHPEFVLSQARLRSLDASRERLESETFPKLGLYAGVDAAPKSSVYGVLGVTGELPFAQRNQGPREVVARATESEHTRHEIQIRRISREVTGAWFSHERRRAEFEVLTKAALPAAERSFELAEAGWKAGRFDWFRVALAGRDLIEVRAQRVEALAALWTQRILLARARGGDAP